MEVRGIYRHFKNNHYEVIGEALDEALGEEYILYRQLHATFGFWVRPKDMFLGYKKDGATCIQRFMRIADNQKDYLTGVDLNDIEITHSESKQIYKIVNQLDGKFIVKKQDI